MAGMLEMTLGLREWTALLERWTGSYLCGPRHGELFGQTLGLVGYGHIGHEVARRARAFGMIVTRARQNQTTNSPNASTICRSLMTLALRILSSLPRRLSDSTCGLFNGSAFAKMKSNAVIVNVARGAIIDETALFSALKSKRIAGAVIDTWYHYPKQGEDSGRPGKLPFHELENIIMTPHASAWTSNLMARRCRGIADNLNRLARGEPLNNIVKKGAA